MVKQSGVCSFLVVEEVRNSLEGSGSLNEEYPGPAQYLVEGKWVQDKVYEVVRYVKPIPSTCLLETGTEESVGNPST